MRFPLRSLIRSFLESTIMKQTCFRLVGWRAAVVALALAACNGSGDPGDSMSLTANTPSTQAAVHELVDAFAATLTGAQQVPMRPSDATGSGTVAIHAGSRRMTAVLTTAGIAGTGANIHQGPPGTIGPILFPLVETPAGSGIWTATAILTEAQYNAFKTGEFYFNVQSLAFVGGEIRGQITAHVPGSTPVGSATSAAGAVPPGSNRFVSPVANSTGTFLAALRGSQEVPPNPSTALGSGTILIDPASRQMTAALATSGMVDTSAHIHEAAPGVNGPIVIPLAEAVTASGVWVARATLTEDQYKVLKAGNFYFNVHSTAFPAGEIRGQILPQQLSLTGITGVDGNTLGSTPATTGSGTTGTGTGMTGTGTTGIGTTGPGTTGTGITGTGLTGTGLTGAGLTGAGSPSAAFSRF